MTPRSAPLAWVALAIGAFVAASVARVAALPEPGPQSGPQSGRVSAEVGGGGEPVLAIEAPAAEAPGLPRGALVVRYGGDVAAARRVLGSEATRADLRRIAALGADAVALDVRIDGGAGAFRASVGLTLEGDARVIAAARLARAEGLAVLLWPIVVASPSGPRLDDQLGLLAPARLRRQHDLRVAAGRLARRAGASGLVALDGRIGSATEAKRVAPGAARSALAAWRSELAADLRAASAPACFVVVDGSEALGDAAAGALGVPDGWGLGAWVPAGEGGPAGEAPPAGAASLAAALAAAAGERPALLVALHRGGAGEPLVALAGVRSASAPGAALVVGTWRYGGGGALGALPRSVWERLAR